MDFNKFKQAVAKQFASMTNTPLFVVDVTGDDLWDTYLSSFPEGTNPIYRKRTEHDCSCCRQFIRNLGNVVTIVKGKLVSIWDVDTGDDAYNAVAKALSDKVRAGHIDTIYQHYESSVGTDKNFEQLVSGQKTWTHFFVNLPSRVVDSEGSVATLRGEAHTSYALLRRAVDTISDEAIDTVLELIAQKSIYRGDEHLPLVTRFKIMKQRVTGSKSPLELTLWLESAQGNSTVNAIRNTVIGTLLVDLSEGVPLERAVASFESKVAPANYKRPTALVTKAMISAAKNKIEELGLTSALERRHATIDDIQINDILFASRDARRTITKDVFDELSSMVTAKPKLDKVEEVSIDRFISDILPTVTSMEVLVENRHLPNFVSLIAPVNATAPGLFKWDNGFSWSYSGEMADSIKERVKQAGGSVTGDLCCRLAWEYTDDLDFHMYEPLGSHIYYGNRRCQSRNGGILDVDANGGDEMMDHPVENIYYKTLSSMSPGTYTLKVHNYNRRSSGRGFEVEIDLLGDVHHFMFDRVLLDEAFVEVAKLTKTNAGITITPSLPSTQRSRQAWGLTTQTFVPVTLMCLSPNHWESSGSGAGNKHYFFMLEGCLNEGTARGFFNEFLKPELDQHRKVIEMVGSKMKIESAGRQLSGLGFSSTLRNRVTCRVTSSFTRNITITF